MYSLLLKQSEGKLFCTFSTFTFTHYVTFSINYFVFTYHTYFYGGVLVLLL